MRVSIEKVVAGHDATFHVNRVVGARFGAPYHRHPEVEITWITRGHGTYIVGDAFGRFQAGDLIVHGGGLPHAYQPAPGVQCGTLYLQMLPEAFGHTLWTLPEMRSIHSLLCRAARGLKLSRSVSLQVSGIMEAMAKGDGPPRIVALLNILCHAASDRRAKPLASEGYSPPKSTTGDRRVAKVLAEIEAGWQGGATLGSVANSAGIHPRSLSRFCRRHFKQSFTGLLISRRLAEAARLLLESDLAISEIAFSVGFNNLSNFNRQFLRHYKSAPRIYRVQTSSRF